MQMIKFGKKAVSWVTLWAFFGMISLPVQASMVTTSQLVQQAQAGLEKDNIQNLLARVELRDQLSAMGINVVAADLRVAQLTNAEVAQLNARIDQLPAGSGPLEIILVVFILFVITDMLGATDIFPFVKPIFK